MTEARHGHVVVIGGGPAGLMAAEVLLGGGARVTICDRMPSLGRKLLMAGRGGLNLTHSEDLAAFLARYGAAREALAPAIEALTPSAVRVWCEALGQETFVGSSGRVFPRAMKASPLLRAWLRRLGDAGLEVRLRHRWQGWDAAGRLLFDTPDGAAAIAADATVLALGGASWPRLGSDGGWVETLRGAGIEVSALVASNCGVLVPWSEHFRARFAGEPLKRVAVHVGAHSARGELVVTAAGLEGGAIYALSGPVREALATAGQARVVLDLRPDLDLATLTALLSRPRQKQSLASFLRKTAHLAPVAIGLVNEAALAQAERPAQMPPEALAALVKALPLKVTGLAGLDRAISTAGGVALGEVDGRFMLRRKPGHFVGGEMLDWDAPTGGYLLQASLATGAAAARGALAWCRSSPPA